MGGLGLGCLNAKELVVFGKMLVIWRRGRVFKEKDYCS